ncbi:sigma-70 family RNA polymerase sigma factor [Rubellicoccus peritrichatus]|uniref:Sigma-70 family RNA polymerase sigma factor n=1 Tax=Rubellicoccus peritrichatus TaxID=3080537 RepID=A0AAQ3L873_9BACT|nr:sigma-70 family RNA polymerase sigma factor [Puniceicoccus sp. CR14]WOO40881.1 sigma-70 family RNA polymerase sigma factor [Puniceicoccus sp. CR14]
MQLPEEESISSRRGELYSELLVTNRHRIYGFIYSLLHNHQASEDLMQEVCVVLWRKFDQFQEGTDFAVWAMSVARFCALNWRRKQARLPLPLENEDIIRLADESMAVGCQLSERHEHLQHCLEKLPVKLRKIVKLRYHKEVRVADIAGDQGISVRSVYLFLERAHALLHECVQRQMNSNPSNG